MQQRGLAMVFILTIVTLGIYSIYWFAKTRGEMNAKGADVPTTWLIIIPIVSIYYLYKYSMGVEKVTGAKMNGVVAFIILWFLTIVGMLIVQNEFNALAGGTKPAAPAAAAA